MIPPTKDTYIVGISSLGLVSHVNFSLGILMAFNQNSLEFHHCSRESRVPFFMIGCWWPIGIGCVPINTYQIHVLMLLNLIKL